MDLLVLTPNALRYSEQRTSLTAPFKVSRPSPFLENFVRPLPLVPKSNNFYHDKIGLL